MLILIEFLIVRFTKTASRLWRNQHFLPGNYTVKIAIIFQYIMLIKLRKYEA